MGWELTIQSLSRLPWPGTSGRDRADPRSAGGGRRDQNPAGVQTQAEALSHIRLLSKSGRTAELAALLRSSQVFREAWQSLQQLSPEVSESPGGLMPFPGAQDQPEAAAPLPGAGSPGRQLTPVGDLPPRQVPATPASSPEATAAQTYPVLSSRPTSPLAAARRVYETQARYLSPEDGGRPRLSLRV